MKPICVKEMDRLRLPWLEEAIIMRMAMACDARGRLTEPVRDKLFPGRPSVTHKIVERAMDKLAAAGLVRTCTKEGQPCLQLVPPGEAKKLEEDLALAERFARFWAKYPKKVAKQDAVRAWKKLRPDESLTQTILAAVERLSKTEQWTKGGGQYVPNPSTFLNGKRWQDELPSGPPPRGGGWDFPQRQYAQEELDRLVITDMRDL